MTFWEFQKEVKSRSFSRRQVAFHQLMLLVSARFDYMLAYPNLLLFVTPEDFAKALEAVA